MKVRALLLTAAVLAAVSLLVARGTALSLSVAEMFGYACESCPANWGALDEANAACAEGRIQSPIAFSEGDLVAASLPKLAIRLRPTTLTVERLGTNFEAFVRRGHIEIGGTRFELDQFHFHSRSEHVVDGEVLPLELHFVHRDAGGALAVLAVIILRGDVLPGTADLLAALDEIAEAEEGDTVRVAGFDPNVLLPAPGSATVRYQGSTTTPPCVEGVQWILLAEPIKMSREQIQSIRRTIHAINQGFDNNRPVQPRNRREITTEGS